MFRRHGLADQVNELVSAIQREPLDQGQAQERAQKVLAAARGASAEQLDHAVDRLAPLIASASLGRAALLAVVSGALVEAGARVEPLIEPVYARFSEAVPLAIPFVAACLAERAASGAAASGAAASGEPSAPGGQDAVTRFGQDVSQRLPDAARAFGSLEWLSTAALAVLMRSKPLRARLKSDTPLVEATTRLADLGFELPCFPEMIAVLDDERIIVLHPELARGYIIRIAGIGKNFELYTLLADALIGDVAQGWLPGERPPANVVALAKNAPVGNPNNLPSVQGAFNLWNWTGLGANGAFPEGQFTGSAHWIWIEGLPADIVRFQGTRVILVGPAPYARGWNGGRFFPGMTGELEVIQQLTPEEARAWLDRIASAPKPTPAQGHITHADIENVGA